MDSNLRTALVATALVAFVAPTQAMEEHVSAQASATILDRSGEAVGEIQIRQGPNGTLFTLEADGLPSGQKAIHLHGAGHCSDHDDGFQASGGHLNPDGRQHGLMNPDGPDAGDFPNFHVHEDGYAWAEFFNDRVSLDGSFGARILDEDGAALVIHENADDHASQPIGGAGARIACAVIEEM